MNEPIQVITLSNGPARYFNYFLRSCARVGFKPEVLDPGPGYSPFETGGVKWKLLYRYITRDNCAAKYLLYVDSHDLVFVHHLGVIFEKFKALKASIVASADSDCWPHKELIQRHPRTADPYRFVNSGGIMGERDAFVEMLEGLGAQLGCNKGNDQGHLAIYFCENWSRSGFIRLDTIGSIWTSLHFAEYVLELRHGMIRNTLTDTYPSIIHGNGGVNIRHIIDYLNI